LLDGPDFPHDVEINGSRARRGSQRALIGPSVLHIGILHEECKLHIFKGGRRLVLLEFQRLKKCVDGLNNLVIDFVVVLGIEDDTHGRGQGVTLL
jgi:hypothetical protein